MFPNAGIICTLLIFGGVVAECLTLQSTNERQKDNTTVCYECNSLYDPRCGDPFDPYTIGKVDCAKKAPLNHIDEKPTFCRKTKQKVHGKVRVIRGCGYVREAKDSHCLLRTGTHDVQVSYCSCKSYLCNSANHRSSATALTILILAIRF